MKINPDIYAELSVLLLGFIFYKNSMPEKIKEEYKITEEEEKMIEAFREAKDRSESFILEIVCRKGKIYSSEQKIIKYYSDCSKNIVTTVF